MDQPGFFEVDERLGRLSDLGDQLEAFARVVDFEQFRSDLKPWPTRIAAKAGGHRSTRF